MAASVYSRTLRKAMEILGGRAKLAGYLRVPESELQKWLADEARPPTAQFLAAVDLVIDEASLSEQDEAPGPRDGITGNSPATRR